MKALPRGQWLGGVVVLVVMVALLLRPFPTHADGPQQTADQACQLCHSDTDAVVTLPSGDEVPVQVDLALLAQSVHGDAADTPLACAECHQTINDYQFPHTPLTATDLRDFQLEKSADCQRCHVQPHLTSHPEAEADNYVACVDCHGGHDVQPAASWHEAGGTATCAECHSSAGVKLVAAEGLTAVIDNGLFTNAVDSDYCLACHSQPGLEVTFANGDTKSATIDEGAFHSSVHGLDSERPLNCTNCHEDYEYPHEPVTAESARAYSLEMYPLCANCHEGKYEQALDSMHEVAWRKGMRKRPFALIVTAPMTHLCRTFPANVSPTLVRSAIVLFLTIMLPVCMGVLCSAIAILMCLLVSNAMACITLAIRQPTSSACAPHNYVLTATPMKP